MKTLLQIETYPNGSYPYIFKIDNDDREYQLSPVAGKWLLTVNLRTIAQWSNRKKREVIIGEAVTKILSLTAND